MWLLVVLACSTEPIVADPVPVAAPAVEQAAGPTWSDELAEVDRRLEVLQTQARTRTGDWLLEQQIAELYAARARLTGSYDDHAAAGAALDRAFAIAPEGSGPIQTRAAHAYTLHRLDAAEADLARLRAHPRLDNRQQAAVALLGANVAFQRGLVDEAERGYEAALALHDSPQVHAALAHAAGWRGDMARAETELARAESMYHGVAREPAAWFHLQRGLWDLDQGKLDDALAHYRDAERLLPGYWLVREHIAEVHLLQGHPELALPIYREVVAATGSPELMSALAEVLAATGAADEAKTWVAQADEAYAAQIAQFPEAAGGHALDHFLAHGQPQRALSLALANAELRPNAEALTQLARAQLAAGLPVEARATIAKARATGWASPQVAEVELALAQL